MQLFPVYHLPRLRTGSWTVGTETSPTAWLQFTAVTMVLILLEITRFTVQQMITLMEYGAVQPLSAKVNVFFLSLFFWLCFLSLSCSVLSWWAAKHEKVDLSLKWFTESSVQWSPRLWSGAGLGLMDYSAHRNPPCPRLHLGLPANEKSNSHACNFLMTSLFTGCRSLSNLLT